MLKTACFTLIEIVVTMHERRRIAIHSQCLAVFLFAVSLIACSPEAKVSPGLAELRRDFIVASQATNIRPLLSLYHLEGCDPNTLSLLKGALTYELGLPIKTITFEPLSGAPEESIHYAHDGINYGPSLPPSKRMRVVYDIEDGLTSLFTIGQTENGTWRIISAKPLPELSL